MHRRYRDLGTVTVSNAMMHWFLLSLDKNLIASGT
jgi:hypothetical protein